MARVHPHLLITHTRAFYALVDCARVIAETEGVERAEEWAKGVLEADISLFCRAEMGRRLQLRIVEGGRR